MLVSLGVENFRSFKKKTDIELKPITVFVGKNSCGKSSFLRLFPLFRQSVEANTMGPILWFGRYVDFGDFNNVLFKGSEKEQIKFYFKVEISPPSKRYSHPFFEETKNEKLNVTVELAIKPDGQKTKYESLRIFFDTFEISINQFSNKTMRYSVIDSNKNIEELESNGTFLEKTNFSHLLPLIQLGKDLDKKTEALLGVENILYKKFLIMRNLSSYIHYYDAYLELKKYFSRKTDESSVLPQLSSIGITQLNKFKLLEHLKKIFKHQKIFNKNLDKYYPEIYKAITPKLLLANLNPLLQEIDNNLNNTFSNIRYIAPIRAITERFYRFQDLQVNEMDHTGSNMAMLLNSLNETNKKLFGAWVKENFNFSVAVEASGPHYAINIIDENGIKYNISDMGFGYSQLLPIIMSLWLETQKKETKKNQRNNDLFFVIEQPELHLHPAYQTQLAKLFAKIIAKASQFNIKIIVETHSQYFINALGESVEQKQISKDDISIVVFNKKDEETEIREANFDKQGILENWPIGFFSGE